MNIGAGGQLIENASLRDILAINGLWRGEFVVKHADAQGKIKYEDIIKNNLTYQGSEYMQKVCFAATSAVAAGGWYYAAYLTTTTVDASKQGSAAATGECTDTGYTRIQATTGAIAPTIDQNPSYWRVSFEAKPWSPGANNWAALRYLGVVGGGTASSAGSSATWFLAYAQFSVDRDLAPNDTLTVQYRLTLSSP